MDFWTDEVHISDITKIEAGPIEKGWVTGEKGDKYFMTIEITTKHGVSEISLEAGTKKALKLR